MTTRQKAAIGLSVLVIVALVAGVLITRRQVTGAISAPAPEQ